MLKCGNQRGAARIVGDDNSALLLSMGYVQVVVGYVVFSTPLIDARWSFRCALLQHLIGMQLSGERVIWEPFIPLNGRNA